MKFEITNNTNNTNDSRRKTRTMAKQLSVIVRQGKTMEARLMRELQMDPSQARFLHEIVYEPGISQEELAKKHRIDKGAVSKAIKKLEALKYVKREQNRDDRRAYKLYPTEKAIEIDRKASKEKEKLDTALINGMTPEEVQIFGELLTRVTANIDRLIERERQLEKTGNTKKTDKTGNRENGVQ